METVITDYVRVRGVLLPSGDVPWRRFRTTKTPRVMIDDPHSPIQVVQKDGEDRERQRWGLPTRLVDKFGGPNHQPDSNVRVLSGTFPLYRPTQQLVVEFEYGPIFEVDVPEVRPHFRQPLTATEIDDGYRLTWEVEAGSNEDLVHDVLLRDEENSTWECRASGLEDSEVIIRNNALDRGERTMVAVETWDGFYTVSERGRLTDLMETELDVRILHPRRGRRHELAPVLLEALTFVDGEIESVPDEAVAWYVDDERVASGIQALWSKPEGGFHRVRVEIEYGGASRSAETRIAVADGSGEGSGSRPTGT